MLHVFVLKFYNNNLKDMSIHGFVLKFYNIISNKKKNYFFVFANSTIYIAHSGYVRQWL